MMYELIACVVVFGPSALGLALGLFAAFSHRTRSARTALFALAFAAHAFSSVALFGLWNWWGAHGGDDLGPALLYFFGGIGVFLAIAFVVNAARRNTPKFDPR